MKALVLSVTAGEGHNTCAKGIVSYLDALGVECSMLDTIKYASPVVGATVDKGYLYMGKILPQTWAAMYSSAERKTRKNRAQNLNVPSALLYKKLEDYVLNYDPDVVLCTNVLAAIIMKKVRDKEVVRRIPIIGVNTDFTLHPFWEDANPDYIVLASHQMIQDAVGRGFDPRYLLPMGIPTHNVFSKKIEKTAARYMLGLMDKTTLLIMGGSMGFGDTESILKQLENLGQDYQIVIICGSNKALKARLEKIANENIKVFGYVNNVEVFMDASDCICTKPGGLSVSESIAKGLPMVLTNPIPGLEQRNQQFLVNNSMAMVANEFFSVDKAVNNLLSDEHRLNQMREMQLRYGCKNGGKTLSEWLVKAVPKRKMNTSGCHNKSI